MPGWLKKLLEIFKLDLNASLFKVDNLTVNNTYVTNNAAAPAGITYKDGQLDINLTGLDPAQIKAVGRIVKDVFQSEKPALVENKAGDKILDVRETEASNKNKRILDALKPIISSDDYLALRSSLFLRSQADAGSNVAALKVQILRRFGERGNKISNLCSRGYFDHIPEYLEKAKADASFSYERFLKNFNRFVEESAFAIFIKAADEPVKCRASIIKKIKTNGQYGLKRLLIHGMGMDNIKKIRTIVASIQKDHPEIATSEDEESEHSITIHLKFPSEISQKLV